MTTVEAPNSGRDRNHPVPPKLRDKIAGLSPATRCPGEWTVRARTDGSEARPIRRPMRGTYPLCLHAQLSVNNEALPGCHFQQHPPSPVSPTRGFRPAPGIRAGDEPERRGRRGAPPYLTWRLSPAAVRRRQRALATSRPCRANGGTSWEAVRGQAVCSLLQ